MKEGWYCHQGSQQEAGQTLSCVCSFLKPCLVLIAAAAAAASFWNLKKKTLLIVENMKHFKLRENKKKPHEFIPQDQQLPIPG